MSLGLYVSVPFCRTKCSYCNFASDVFSRSVFQRYVDRVCADIECATETVAQMDGRNERIVDSIYLGGGTPTVLDMAQLQLLFVTIEQNFEVEPEAEITVECAPGTLNAAVIEALQQCAVNRVSLGVQSFVDQEASSVGRLHDRETVLNDIARLRAAGISNINIDLIAGLPHQTVDSWMSSVEQLMASEATHASVYMLEVDEDSRLGRELIAGGAKYHAHFVPDEDLTADLYLMACERLEAAGVRQYEISNFARPGRESRHNLKYWTRQPYLGFGVDAHSMVPGLNGEAVRFSTPDSLEAYVSGAPLNRVGISADAALEETFFLGLRLNSGVDLRRVAAKLGEDAVAGFSKSIADFVQTGLMEQQGDVIRLTSRGRLLSNEVFERFISSRTGAVLAC
ncbi:MAG TPA: radical SAM family heme chaperone HemW [Terriglobales bacterium]|jgi:oxygen-independent coproporphyrinogen-3 oxidase|nr:radical SAM family heme chaperone HemW [Terriglobales bacterium]